MSKLVRLSKILAKSGKFSRREADRLISMGKVKYNGTIVKPGIQVEEGVGNIEVDGELISGSNDKVYIFYKPVGYLSSYYDPNGKKNLSSFEALNGLKLGYSGRLDYDSEGLMLFTADGNLIYQLQRSEFQVEKEYIIDVSKDITKNQMEVLRRGLVTREESYLPCKATRISEKNYRVVLIEGKKRQVRKMFAYFDSKVIKLKRVRIGTVLLGNLMPGNVRILDDKEVDMLHSYIYNINNRL